MWTRVTGLLLLLVLGSKCGHWLLQLALAGLAKVGLLSDIRIDAATTLTVVVSDVHVSFWRCVLRFIRTPTKEKLLSIEVPALHFVITTADLGGKPRRTPPSAPSFDTGVSLKSILHPAWKRIRPWLHHFHIIYFVLHWVTLSIPSLSIDIVRKESDQIVLLSVEHGSLRIAFESKADSFQCLVHISYVQPTVAHIPDVAGELQLGATEIRVSIPESRDQHNARPPIPTMIAFQCESINIEADVLRIFQTVWQTNHVPVPFASEGDTTEMDHSEAARLRNDLLPLWIMDAFPDNITFQLNSLDVKLNGGYKCELQLRDAHCKLNDISIKVFDPTVRFRDSGVSNFASKTPVERKMIVELAELEIGVIDSGTPPIILLGFIKSDVEVKVEATKSGEITRADDKSFVEDTSWKSTLMIRINGEMKGLTIRATADIGPWVQTVHHEFKRLQTLGLILHPSAESAHQPTMPLIEYVEAEMQFKVSHCEVQIISLDRRCSVLPKGVPDIHLVVDEIILFGHPFSGEHCLGVRSAADLQCSRLKVYYAKDRVSEKTCFLSLDFARVFIGPVSFMNTSQDLAEVEMEAEWLEIKWSPDAMHAIGGALELGVYVMAPFLTNSYPSEVNLMDRSTSSFSWYDQVLRHVPSMNTIQEVCRDELKESELIQFRCCIKRTLAIFVLDSNEETQVEYLTVETVVMSVEQTTGRFRISIQQIKAFHADEMSGDRQFLPSFVDRRPPRRSSFRAQSGQLNRAEKCLDQMRGNNQRIGGSSTTSTHVPYFTVDIFALEETQITELSSSVIDMFADKINCEWSMDAQLRVMELVRQVTYSTWEMLYRMRSAYGTYCTSCDSVYNRDGGLNAPLTDLSECLMHEEKLNQLISSTGDKLNRMRATNVTLRASIAPDIEIGVSIGLFGGDDLPDLWIFDQIGLRVNGHHIVLVEGVSVRHTIDKRRDYVFGEFENMVRRRQGACQRYTTASSGRDDGMLVDIKGLHLQCEVEFPLLAHLNSLHETLSPFLVPLNTILTSNWRPQEAVFYQYFLKNPVYLGQMNVWLQIQNFCVECIDKPFESWLERLYPLWIDELEEQELRSQVLEEQLTTIKLTNADMLSENVLQEMKILLVEKNAKIYVDKVKKQLKLSATGSNQGKLFSVSIGQIDVDLVFKSDQHEIVTSIRDLDESSNAVSQVFENNGLDKKAYIPLFDLLMGMELSVTVADMGVRVRNFSSPLAICDRIEVAGKIFIAAPSTSERYLNTNHVFASNLRCFLDTEVTIVHPVLFFSPGYLYALDDIACLAKSLLPLMLLDIDKQYSTAPWDILRRLLHGKVNLSVQDATLRLLQSTNSFGFADYLDISVQQMSLGYTAGHIVIQIRRLTAKIEPGALSNIAEFRSVKIQVWIEWSANEDASMHYMLPVQYRSLGIDNNDRLVVDIRASRILKTDETHQVSHIFDLLNAFQATGVSVFVRGEVSPDANINTGESSNAASTRSKREIASRTSVVLYTKHVEWLILFASLYKSLPPYPFHRRSRYSIRNEYLSDSTPAQTALLNIFNGLVIESFDVLGLDLIIYESEKRPIGIRACINGKLGFSGALLQSNHLIFTKALASAQTRRLTVCAHEAKWIVHEVIVVVQDVQIRVCTPDSGSRGESLVSVTLMSVHAGGGSEKMPVHTAIFPAQPMPQVERINSFTSKIQPRKNILDHFAIPQHNPFCFRDSDQEANSQSTEMADTDIELDQTDFASEFRHLGFLVGLFARDARIVVTPGALDTLIDVGENWIRVVLAHLPEPVCPLEAKPKHKKTATNSSSRPDSSHSPRKVTSLAEDPKYSDIFYRKSKLEPIELNMSADFASMKRKSFRLTETTAPTGNYKKPTPDDENDLEPLFMVTFMDCQISIQDQANKGSVLLALNCGTLKDFFSLDRHHERIDLMVDGLQLFTAPLDIDVKSRIIWLKALADGSYCPSSQSLLKQVIAPIPTQVIIWIDRETVVRNKVEIQIPNIEVSLSTDSKDILQNLAMVLTTLLTTKLAQKNAPNYYRMLYTSATRQSEFPRSIPQLQALKKQIKWSIAHLQWRQTCRWNHYLSERANVAFTAAENGRSLAYEIETSPLFRRRVSSAATTIMSLTGTVNTQMEPEQNTDELQRYSQQYETVSELLRAEIKAEQKKLQPRPNVELQFLLQMASLTLSGVNSDIIRLCMETLRFKMQQYEDQSGSFALILKNLTCANLCPATPYPDLLGPLNPTKERGRDIIFIRADAEIAAPVGGITVVQHLEVNTHPLQVCITQEVILQLVAFFTPPTTMNSPRQEEQRKEFRSQFLQRPDPSSYCNDGLVGTALKKAAKAAGKAAQPLSLGLSRHREEHEEDGRTRSGRFTHDSASAWTTKMLSHPPNNDTQLLLRSDEESQDAQADAQQSNSNEINEMKDRASNNILFKRIRLGMIEVVVTYKNKKSHNHQALEDMRGFNVKIHALVYCDKTCTTMDLLLRIRRDVILDVLSQVGRNFTNIATFLRDQCDITRWAAFDGLAPLKHLPSNAVAAFSATPSAVAPAPLESAPPSVSTSTTSPRGSADHAKAPATQATVSESAKVFHLEMPEHHHSSLRKTFIPSLRYGESSSRSSPSTQVVSPSHYVQDDETEEQDSKTHQHHSLSSGKARKALSQLFSKKRTGAIATRPASVSEPSSPVPLTHDPASAT